MDLSSQTRRQMSGHVFGLSPAPMAPAFPQCFEGRQGHDCHCELIPAERSALHRRRTVQGRLLLFGKERREIEPRAGTLGEGHGGWSPGQITDCDPLHQDFPLEEGRHAPVSSGLRARLPAVLGPGASMSSSPGVDPDIVKIEHPYPHKDCPPVPS